MKFKSQIVSEIATGIAPLTVASTTLVSNLNVQKWNGQDLPSITGNGGKVLSINSEATALEWSTPTSLPISANNVVNTPSGNISSTTVQAAINELDQEKSSTTHVHGNITNSGAIGSTANLAVITTTGGVLTTGTVPLTSGGTGASTADAARTNLAAPKVFIQAGTPTATNAGDIWFIP